MGGRGNTGDRSRNQTLQDIPMGEKIEIKEFGDRYSSGVYRVYTRTAWGYSRDNIPGFQPKSLGVILEREFDRYEDRWRKR